MTDVAKQHRSTPKPWRGRRARRLAWVARLTGLWREAYDDLRADYRQFNQLYALGRPMQKTQRLAEQAARARRKKRAAAQRKRRAEARGDNA